uniref:Ubiquitin carboxyl-terminal hydrolase n=1 Tax=Cyanistes caeruleus TaxID=156563 RepID=A0A8C0TXL0_CYACU
MMSLWRFVALTQLSGSKPTCCFMPGKTMEQAAQRSCGCPIPGRVQGQVGWGLEDPAPPKRILFPPEKIYRVWQQQQSAGAGLFNVGNTCFLNAVLQCLTYTPPLANYLLSREHSKQGFCMMCTMEAHVNKVLHSPVSAIVPWAVLKVFGRKSWQEDAHDFLCCTVNAMQRACLSASSDLDLSSESTTIVHQIFGGFLRSRGAFPQLLLSLTLPVPFCLRGCLASLGEDWVHFSTGLCLCLLSRCTENVAASKRFTIHCAPKVLTVCLKRFDCFTGGKINKAVEYPEFLDLRPYMSEGDGEPLYYSLYAVLVHSGYSCHEGHYFCYTKASNGLWYQMDDESVEVRSIDTALGQQAYLLFYSSRPGWMGLGGSRSIVRYSWAAWEQIQLRLREQRSCPQLGYDFCCRFVRFSAHHRSVRKRRVCVPQRRRSGKHSRHSRSAGGRWWRWLKQNGKLALHFLAELSMFSTPIPKEEGTI